MADNQTEKQKVQELTDKLERGLTELFNSESYKNYFSTMSKFHNYSFNNTLLIAMQKPEASLGRRQCRLCTAGFWGIMNVVNSIGSSITSLPLNSNGNSTRNRKNGNYSLQTQHIGI